MSQAEVWEKAAECVRAIEVTSDPEERKLLMQLESLWVQLANYIFVLGETRVAREIERIGEIHTVILPVHN
jgi:hypothetical protein